jgi:1-acyl-sn-glycerol-3-phosphate acyltransferase
MSSSEHNLTRTDPVRADATRRAQSASYWFRNVLATCVCAIFATALSPVGALIAHINDGRPANALARIGARFVLWVSRTRVTIRGLEHLATPGKYIFAVNHQSVADIVALAAFLPFQLRFVTKLAVLNIPFFGFAVRRSRHIPIDLVTGEGIRHALMTARLGFSIVVFPEGHRHIDGRVHRFRQGAAWLALRTGLPCVPVAIDGGGEALPPHARIVRVGKTISISIGPPLTSAQVMRLGRNGITDYLQSTVTRMFDDLRDRRAITSSEARAGATLARSSRETAQVRE